MTPADQAARQVRHINSFKTLPELRAYWAALEEDQPDMRAHPTVQQAHGAKLAELYREAK